MRTSQFILTTQRESPSDAEIMSHQLMLRSGMIRKISSGLYAWLPLGLRVLHKIASIVRHELNKIGCLEITMPSLQPANLWHKTNRWDAYGDELLKIKDRHQQMYCYGPTAEEMVADTIFHMLHSYKQLPLIVYQMTNKFRDEIRPRFGLLRAREFLMKDAYSLHLSHDCLEKTYDQMLNAYCHILKRLQVKFRVVIADSGNMGGKKSHEFQVLAKTGEDEILYCDESDYVVNIEVARKKGLKEGDRSPDGQGILKSCRGIEVGHIFQIGKEKYSLPLNLVMTNATGKRIPIAMASYGLGISRMVAAIIEQYHDHQGICWPESVAPFDISILPIKGHQSAIVANTSQILYQKLIISINAQLA